MIDTIKKTISLEPYKSRLYGGLPYVVDGGLEVGSENESNWDKIIATVDFSKFNDTEKSKYGSGIVKWGKMTYRSIIDEYHKIKNRDIEDIASVSSDESIDAEITEDMRLALVRYVETHSTTTGVEYEERYCSCPLPVVGKEYNVEWVDLESSSAYTAPDINLNILLKQTANLIGSYTFLVKEWVPGKRYYIGDVVLYDNQVYQLDSLVLVETPPSGAACEDIYNQLSDDVKRLYNSSLYYYIWNDPQEEPKEFRFIEISSIDELVKDGYVAAKIGNVYYAKPYWAGYKKGFTRYFDEVKNGIIQKQSDGSTKHWKLHNVATSMLDVSARGTDAGIGIRGKGVDFNFESYTYNVVGESRLDEFLTVVRSIDVETREKLPGKINGDVLELPYSIGYVRNVESVTDGEDLKYTGDYLHGIEVFNSDDVSVGNFTGETAMNAYVTWLRGYDGTGTVKFTYYVGCEVEYDGEKFVVKKDGDRMMIDPSLDMVAEYVDTYDFEIAQISATTEEGVFNLKYMNIDYDSASEVVVMENIDNFESLTRLSSVEYNTNLNDVVNESPNLITAPVFMEDYKLGVSYVDNHNVSDFTIDRGNAAAFERHLRLTEVKTMSDLENYGNGFFELKK